MNRFTRFFGGAWPGWSKRRCRLRWAEFVKDSGQEPMLHRNFPGAEADDSDGRFVWVLRFRFGAGNGAMMELARGSGAGGGRGLFGVSNLTVLS